MVLPGSVFAAPQAVYQYAVPVAHRTAYLWVPAGCPAVRGVIVTFANLTERQWLEDPAIRATAEQQCLGTIWIGPGDESILNADLKPGAGEALQEMFRAFAQKSGFPELEFAPVIPMGHSAHGQFAWRFAQWAPERTIAAIPIKTVPLPANLDLPGIPLLYLVGETTEWPQYRDGRPGDRDFFWPRVRDSALKLRALNQANLISVVTAPGSGHFDWSPSQARFVALFIRKACEVRLPHGPSLPGPIHLRALRPDSGWLTDASGVLPEAHPAAPYQSYQGAQSSAYWFFDRETALAAVAFNGDRVRRKKQMLTFEQDGQLLPVAKQGFAPLKFEPEADGITFKLTPAFLPSVPQELIGAGALLGHANGEIHLSVVTGPAEQVAPTEFRVAMQRGDDGGDIWIEEEQDGNAEFRKAVQPGKLHIPARLTEGSPQSIRLDPLPGTKSSSPAMRLHAVSTSGLPVRFYVEYGPAQVAGDRLILTQVPRHATLPIEVKVVAYQWGRMASGNSPAIQTAEPVARTFLVTPHASTRKEARQ
jgi:pimeloyl-ACP methyl ester carboxylesterase